MMKKLELALVVVTALGILLKFFNLPFSAILLTLSLSSLALVYMGFGAALFSNVPARLANYGSDSIGTEGSSITGTRFLGYAMALVLVGTLFKIQHWPMATMQLMVGLIALILLFALVVFRAQKAKTPIPSGLVVRAVIVGIIGACSILLPVALS